MPGRYLRYEWSQMRAVRPLFARFAAWFVTGPLGHLTAGVLDWLGVLRKVAWARARRREVEW